jgi:mRNA interferase YafQ
MYEVIRLKKFEKAFDKIYKADRNRDKLKLEFENIVDILSSGKSLDIKYRDHQLTGDMKDFRECHIKPDLLLIYQIQNDVLILTLVEVGSHSELF